MDPLEVIKEERKFLHDVSNHLLVAQGMGSFVNKVMNEIWRLIGDLDSFIALNKPFKKIKEDEIGAHKDLKYLTEELNRVAVSLLPFMPETAEKIITCLKNSKIPDEPLFLRKD